MIRPFRSADQAHVLVDALSFLLPHPLSLDGIQVVETTRQHVDTRSPAVLAIGRRGHRAALRSGAGSFAHTYAFRLFPPTSEPRVLFPVGWCHREQSRLLQPRSAPTSISGRLTGAIAAALPKKPVELVSLPVTAFVPAASEVVGALRRLVGDGRIAVFLGNRSNYGRPTLHVFAADGRPAAVAKWNRERAGRQRQSREREVLAALNSFPSLCDTTPKVLAHIHGHLGDALVTDAFAGRPSPAYLEPTIVSWLRRCEIGPPMSAGQTGLVRSLRQDPKLASARNGLLPTALERALSGLADHEVPTTLVHGDFAPWNILIDEQGPKIFDWEYASLEGVPEWDACFFRLQVALVKERVDAARLVSRVVAMEPRLSPATYSELQYRSLLLLVLLQLAVRHGEDATREAIVKSAIERLLEGGWIPSA